MEIRPTVRPFTMEVRPSSELDGQGAERPAPLGLVALYKLFTATRGTLTLDLKRPHLPKVQDAARTSLFTVPRRAARQPAPRRRLRARGARDARVFDDDEDGGGLAAVAFGDSGARIKALRHASFGPAFEYHKHGRPPFTAPAFDLGVGFNFELDSAEMRPIARLRCWGFLSLCLLPAPAVRLQRRLPLGASGYAVRLSYEYPLDSAAIGCPPWAPPARLLAGIDAAADTGLTLTQGGLEFAANRWLLDGDARLRAAGRLALPSELPVVAGDAWLRPEIRRLGLKTVW